METLYTLFIGLKFTTIALFVLKCLIVPILTLLLWYTVYVVWLSLSKSKQPYPVHVKIVNSKSALITIGLLSIYWSVIIHFNGLHFFTWGQFPMNVSNVYLLLLPILLAYIVLITIYFRAKSKITTLIK